MRRLSALALAALFLSACAPLPPPKPKVPTLDVDLAWQMGGAGMPAGPFSYAFAPPNGDEPLVDERLEQLFGQLLVAKGGSLNAAAPQWLIKAGHHLDELQEALPEKQRKETYFEDGQTKIVTRYAHGQPYSQSVQSPGRWRERVIKEPGGTRTVFNLKLSIQVLAASPTAETLPRWEGSVLCRQAEADPLKHAPVLMRELAREFPQGSGQPAHRRVAAR
jgi:hypothetical protein